MLEKYVSKGSKKLRCGFTTGTCAAAASAGAARMLLSGKVIENITVITPSGNSVTVGLTDIKKENDYVSCAVQKDSGDDPDVTDKILVYSTVSYEKSGITVDGGEGVGRVTKKGLKQQIGEAAINPVPRKMIEEQLKVHVYGYVPVVSECVLESRYLGLQIPEEVEKIDEKLEHLARVMEDTVDLDGILELARNVSAMQEDTQVKEHLLNLSDPLQKGIRIAVAHDEAFCFIYPDNLEILKKLGAEIVTFSPIHDRSLPENIQGIVLYGGYPELYAKELSENDSMRESICHAVTLGVPCIAECGGFMYLQERMEGSDGKIYDMAGALFGKSYKTEKLRRFGYIILSKGTVFGHNVGNITAHEFHYYESEECGHAFTAKKPMSTRGWECMISTDTILAGYPHIHYMF